MAQPFRAPSASLLRHLRHQNSQWHRPIALHNSATRQFTSSPHRQLSTSPLHRRRDLSLYGDEKRGYRASELPDQPSLKTHAKRQLDQAAESVPKDLGIWPGTFVAPSLSNLRVEFYGRLVSLQTLRDCSLLLWTWGKTRVQDWISTNYYYRRVIFKQPRKQRPKLEKEKIAGMAQDLHKQLFNAYAKGAKRTISKLCGETLAASMAMRISNRAKGERLAWSVRRYISRPRLMSHKATELPYVIEGAKAGARQAVVRIHTEQALRVGKAVKGKTRGVHEASALSGRDDFWAYGNEEDNVEWEPVRVKDVVEYMVMQRRLVVGKEDEWCVIGFMEPTTVGLIRAWRAGKATETRGAERVPAGASAAPS